MSTARIEGLAGEVRITRDARGIPTVIASTERDLFVGQGFATATDRLGQLAWDRLRAHGRSAELSPTPANVVNDTFNRRARLLDHARTGYDALDVATRGVLDAYVEGVNAAGAAAPTPVELAALGGRFEPWAPWDPVGIFLVRHLCFATWQAKLWNARVAAALGTEAIRWFKHEGRGGTAPVIVPPGTLVDLERLAAAGQAELAGFDRAVLAGLQPLGLAWSGSNAWAVHGARTTSGQPLVAGDPHRALEVPNVYYQLRLHGPDIDAAGLSFVGVPGIQHFAQSVGVAWAVTNAMADYQDLYVESLPAAVTDERVERVLVRDADPVEIECLTTRHGPVVVGGREHGVGLALASTGLTEPGGSLRTILPFLRARSVDDLVSALADWVEPVNNFVLADTTGRIAYRTAGRVPRRDALNRRLPVPGDDPTYDWTGVVAFPDLPAADDPAVGFVVTANQRITDAPIGAELTDSYASPARARRIWERLAERRDLTVDDQRAVLADTWWAAGAELATRVAALGGPGAATVEGWDGHMAADSAPAAFVARVYDQLCRLIAADLPALAANPFAPWEPPATCAPLVLRVAYALGAWLTEGGPDEVDWAAHLPAAVDAALAEPEATWGAIHHARPRFGPVGADPELDQRMTPTTPPLAGGRDCVMATNPLEGLTSRAVFGSTARYVWDLADRAHSRWVVPLGASGDPASPHFTDQLAAWSAGDLYPVDDPTVTSTMVLH